MKIVLIGSGNIATHIGQACVNSGHRIIQVFGRTKSTTKRIANKFKAIAIFEKSDLSLSADLYLIAVPDREIKLAASIIPSLEKIVAHTSGAVSISILPKRFKHAGVLYPLQTMTAGQKVRYSEIPFCIEGRSQMAVRSLNRLASSISNKVVTMDSDSRSWLHLSAVLVNNFPNHLYTLARQLLEERGIEFDLLKPLITETARKIMHAEPFDMQTGPARRGDAAVIDKHLKLLEQEPRLAAIYRLLSDSIEEQHGPML